ncbi:MAG: hypothetical protein KF861_11105 [Planctomycetaceae bacterium]|nr:hypothetical protein [Planctomycetaceae bacterium]
MRYFTRDEFVSTDVDPTSESFAEMNELAARRVTEYEASLAAAIPMWSPTVKEFVSQCKDLHDAAVQTIHLDLQRATLAFHTCVGVIVLSSVQEVRIEGEVDQMDAGTAWLYEEFVIPDNRNPANAGCFQFNVLCELMEVNVIAKTIVRVLD